MFTKEFESRNKDGGSTGRNKAGRGANVEGIVTIETRAADMCRQREDLEVASGLDRKEVKILKIEESEDGGEGASGFLGDRWNEKGKRRRRRRWARAKRQQRERSAERQAQSGSCDEREMLKVGEWNGGRRGGWLGTTGHWKSCTHCSPTASVHWAIG